MYPILAHYNYSLPLKLAAYASQFGIRAMISQVYPNGEEHPVAYASRTFTTAGINYPQVKQEALSIVFGTPKFHQYLYGRFFTIVTDYKPLLTMLRPKKNILPLAAARMQRWALLLSAHQYEIEHRFTQAYGNADTLSRLPLIDEGSEEIGESSVLVECLPVTISDLQRAAQCDALLNKVYQVWMGEYNNIR